MGSDTTPIQSKSQLIVLFAPRALALLGTHNEKTAGRQEEEGTDLFASLDRSLYTSANKNAILRATEVVFQRKGETPATPATGLAAGTADTDPARATVVGCGGLDPEPSPPPLPPRPSASATSSVSGSFSPTQEEAVSIPRKNDNGCGGGNGDGKTDRRPQLKAASSFLGNSLGRIRSVALSTTKELARPDAAGSRRGVGRMKKVGLPRRRVPCEPSAENSPFRLNTPPPLPPRPALPPRVVTQTTTPDGLPPTECDGDDAVASSPPLPATLGSKDGTGGAGGKIGTTQSIVLDGLRLVWTLEIRDSVVRMELKWIRSYSKASALFIVHVLWE